MTLPMVNNQSFINWLRKQPPEKKYAYSDNRNCVICKFFQSYGFYDVYVDGDTYRLDGTWASAKRLPEGWNHVALLDEKTFGAAYERALEWLD